LIGEEKEIIRRIIKQTRPAGSWLGGRRIKYRVTGIFL
jgi:hypothetical protein